MKDKDRNINSPLYKVSKISHINDIAPEVLVNFKNVFTANVNAVSSHNVDMPIAIRILIWNINEQTAKIKSTIQILKRVK